MNRATLKTEQTLGTEVIPGIETQVAQGTPATIAAAATAMATKTTTMTVATTAMSAAATATTSEATAPTGTVIHHATEMPLAGTDRTAQVQATDPPPPTPSSAIELPFDLTNAATAREAITGRNIAAYDCAKQTTGSTQMPTNFKYAGFEVLCST